MPNLKYCEKISNAFGPSGHEHEVADTISELLNGFSVKRDGMQNAVSYTHLDVYKRQP